MPDGSTLTNAFAASSTLFAVNEWIANQSGESKLLLSLSYPRKVYEIGEQEIVTLAELPGT